MGIELAEALLGQSGFRVLEVTESTPLPLRRRTRDRLPRPDPRQLFHGDPRPPPHRRPTTAPPKALNLSVKRVKRCGYRHRSSDHYRPRVLVHTGGVTWPERPSPRIRTHLPYSNA